MDFIRKNWSRLSLAFLFLIGGIFAIIAWVNSHAFELDDGFAKFYYTALLISTVLYFFGMVAVTIVKSLENSKKMVSILYMAIGGIITVLLLVVVIVACCKADYTDIILVTTDAKYGMGGGIAAFYMLWVQVLVFGLYPLIKGLTRFIEAEHVPAKPAVQPTVQATAPVAETAPAAPKAAARKTAPKTPAAK